MHLVTFLKRRGAEGFPSTSLTSHETFRASRAGFRLRDAGGNSRSLAALGMTLQCKPGWAVLHYTTALESSPPFGKCSVQGLSDKVGIIDGQDRSASLRYRILKGLMNCAPRATKSLSFRVATLSPWTRAAAAIMASSRRCSAFPSINRAHSRKQEASIGRTL